MLYVCGDLSSQWMFNFGLLFFPKVLKQTLNLFVVIKPLLPLPLNMGMIKVPTLQAILAELWKVMEQSTNKLSKRKAREAILYSIMTTHEIEEAKEILKRITKKTSISSATNWLYKQAVSIVGDALPTPSQYNSDLTKMLASSPAYEATFVTVNRIKKQLIDIFPQLVSEDKIYILLKGGVAASLAIKKRIKEKCIQVEGIFELFQRGDNDIGIYIDPGMGKEEFDSVYAIVNAVVTEVMLEDRPLYEHDAPLGQVIVQFANNDFKPANCVHAKTTDVFLQRQDWVSCSIDSGETRHGVRYSLNESVQFVDDSNSFVSFSLHRLKMVFRVNGKLSTGEILDVAISKFDDESLKKVFNEWVENSISITLV